jgi:hypothetical protein
MESSNNISKLKIIYSDLKYYKYNLRERITFPRKKHIVLSLSVFTLITLIITSIIYYIFYTEDLIRISIDIFLSSSIFLLITNSFYTILLSIKKDGIIIINNNVIHKLENNKRKSKIIRIIDIEDVGIDNNTVLIKKKNSNRIIKIENLDDPDKFKKSLNKIIISKKLVSS